MTDHQDRRAWAGLLRACEPPAPGVVDLVGEVGVPEAWHRVRSGSVTGPARRETAARTHRLSTAELEDRITADFRAAATVGARLVVPGDDEWPEEIGPAFRMAGRRGADGAVEPLALWIRGSPVRELPEEGVAIVGSRACSDYGRRVASGIASGLAERGRVVVSGAAFGIDAAAHRAALAADHPRPTVAVMACGIDRAYPGANRPLIEAIAGRGSVVTEYAPGTTPAKHRFLVRNRLIAALGRGTLVIEAGRRSGTLSTAKVARYLNRPVMAVPGSVEVASSVGCHTLIAEERAQLVTGLDDVLRTLWPAEATSVGASADLRETDQLSGEELRILDALPVRRGTGVADVAHESAIPIPRVLAGLAVLDLYGLARSDVNGWRRVRTS